MTDPGRNTPDSIVERVAEALFNTRVGHARADLAAHVFPLDRIQPVFESALRCSDREAAIIIFALVDDLMTSFYKERLTGKVQEGVEQTILSGNGPLASAYNKINLLSALSWIGEVTYRQLTFMRKIRNEFAHHVKYQSFDDAPIGNFIEAMEPSEQSLLEAVPPEKKPSKLPLRARYLIRSALGISFLCTDLVTFQAAEKHGVPARAIPTFDYELESDNIKDLMRAVSGISLAIIESVLPPAAANQTSA
jgi:DNA-binding MltR family transcriptional regulator